MPKVLHIGPCDTPGGMANVMRILAEHPPEGWEAELLSSHVTGSPWAKWRAYRRARKTLVQMLKDPGLRPDVIHLHTAADWSWWRKRRFAMIAHKAGVPNIVHIHSGQFDTWLGTPDSKRSRALKTFLQANKSNTVVLSKEWKQVLEPYIGPVHAMNNPVDANIRPRSVERDRFHLLLLGRNDPVKGHNFGIQVGEKVREVHPQLQVSMTGISISPHTWLSAKGWIEEEEKLHLLQTATLLLVPSAFEGQPLVVLEALTCGLQAIVSDRIKSLPEGTIRAPYEDVDAWVSSICQYLESPTEINFQTDEFRIEHVSEQWGIFYSKCVNPEAQ